MAVKATLLSKEDFHSALVPGSFYLTEPDPSDKEQSFWYCCPCGCGVKAPLLVGNGFKPADGPSWSWNGSFDKPTLEPSINHKDHWHGYLRNGIWLLTTEEGGQ